MVQRPPNAADRRGLTGEAFSLVFGGGPARPLADGTYTLTHPSAGTLSLFLVAVGMAHQGQRPKDFVISADEKSQLQLVADVLPLAACPATTDPAPP